LQTQILRLRKNLAARSGALMEMTNHREVLKRAAVATSSALAQSLG